MRQAMINRKADITKGGATNKMMESEKISAKLMPSP
jgi:hypothetical protein